MIQIGLLLIVLDVLLATVFIVAQHYTNQFNNVQ